MPLERLEPVVKKYNLGCIRLWQDELAEIVRLIGQLPEIDVYLESDSNKFTDVRADLPQLGQRVSYFTAKGTRTESQTEPPKEIITVKLARDRCEIEAIEPDATTRGVIEDIKSLTRAKRRLPVWLLNLYAVPSNPSATTATSGAPWAVLIMAVLLIFIAVFGTEAIQYLVHTHSKLAVSWPASICVAGPCLVLFVALALGWMRAKTLLITATHESAPTFWQRKRAYIAINVVVALVFFLIGLLISQH